MQNDLTRGRSRIVSTQMPAPVFDRMHRAPVQLDNRPELRVAHVPIDPATVEVSAGRLAQPGRKPVSEFDMSSIPTLER